MNKGVIAIFFLAVGLGLLLVQFACTPGSLPSAPTGTSSDPPPTPTGTLPTSTFTPTVTDTPTGVWTPLPTATFTNTPTPLCLGVTDLTDYVDGADYFGDDTGKTLPGIFNIGGGAVFGEAFSFVALQDGLYNFSLCPTEQADRRMSLYVRPACDSAAGQFFNGGHCAGLPQLTGVPLSFGVYYIIVVENEGSIPGPYRLRINTRNLSTAVCLPQPGASFQTVPPNVYDSCGTPYELNAVTQPYGNPFSGIRAAEGQLDDSLDPNVYFSFTPANSGPVTVILDCFDNGLNNWDFDVYAAESCPVGSAPPIIAQSNSLEPVEQFTFEAVGGTTYYLNAQAYLGSGSYRLFVSTP